MPLSLALSRQRGQPVLHRVSDQPGLHHETLSAKKKVACCVCVYFIYMYVSVYMDAVCAGVPEGQKGALDPLELELQVVVSHLI